MLSVAEINECEGENSCHDNATCTNTIGSYNCSCYDGFEGNGTNCEGKRKVSRALGYYTVARRYMDFMFEWQEQYQYL